VFAIATAVYADIPDNGVIHGCYAKYNGALRVIDTDKVPDPQHCLSNEIPLDWNQVGPTGATGATGATGPTGPSELVTNYQSFENEALDTDSTATLASVSLAAGKYSLQGAARYFGTGDRSVVHCQYATSGGASSLHQLPFGSVLDVTAGSEDPVFATIPIVGDITVTTGPTTVNLVCKNDGSDTADIQSGAIIATKVDTITAQ
jgi:hypothetical protein